MRARRRRAGGGVPLENVRHDVRRGGAARRRVDVHGGPSRSCPPSVAIVADGDAAEPARLAALLARNSRCAARPRRRRAAPPPYAVSLMYGWSNECAAGHWLCEPLRAAACEAVRVRSMSKMQRHGPSRWGAAATALRSSIEFAPPRSPPPVAKKSGPSHCVRFTSTQRAQVEAACSLECHGDCCSVTPGRHLGANGRHGDVAMFCVVLGVAPQLAAEIDVLRRCSASDDR